MALKNPYCGRRPYAGASNPKDCVKPPCEVATSANAPINPSEEEEQDIVERPDCVALVYATSEDETLQTYTYNEEDDIYEAPTGDTMIFDIALGWLIQTGQATYFPESASETSPFGTFCDSSDRAVTTVPCDKAVFPPPPPEPIILPPCVLTKFADDDTYVLGEFNLDDDEYTPTDPAQGVLAYDEDDGWTLTLESDDGTGAVETTVFTGSDDEETVASLYRDEDGNCILIVECG